MDGVVVHADHEHRKDDRLSRHSVIDVGSNTIHLLVGEVDGGGSTRHRREGLGPSRGWSGEVGAHSGGEAPLAVDAIALFARISALNGVSEPVILATSAVRDAENGPELTERVRELTDLKMRLISGRGGRARISGAVSAVGTSLGGPVLVVDLGGGSAQLIVGEASSGPLMQVSLPLGSNRTTERFVDNDPAKKKELRALDEHVKEMVPGWSLSQRVSVVAVGGSARAILKITRDSLTVERMQACPRDMRDSLGGARARARARSRAGAGDAGGDHHARRDTGALRWGQVDRGAWRLERRNPLTLAEGKEI